MRLSDEAAEAMADVIKCGLAMDARSTIIAQEVWLASPGPALVEALRKSRNHFAYIAEPGDLSRQMATRLAEQAIEIIEQALASIQDPKP